MPVYGYVVIRQVGHIYNYVITFPHVTRRAWELAVYRYEILGVAEAGYARVSYREVEIPSLGGRKITKTCGREADAEGEDSQKPRNGY